MKRVVITGLGVISPVGSTVDTFWDNVVAGRSGIRHIEAFDTAPFSTKIGAEVKDFQPEQYFDSKEMRHLDRFAQFAIAASKQAVEQSGLHIQDDNADRVGVYIGTGIGGIGTLMDNHKTLLERGAKRVSPFFVPMMISNMASGQVAMKLGAKGPNSSPVTACASGNNAIGDAYHLIRRGVADVMIAGGAESPINELSFAGFCNMKAMSTHNDEPEKASRPFDANRDGFIMGEGSGVLVLEELEHALQRGATILAEIVGYGLTCDAHHMTAPDPEGSGAARAMKMAIEDAGLALTDVEYINAHATSTPIGDIAETKAIKNLFGDHAYKLAISATKSITGHLLGAAGGIEAVMVVKTLAEGIIPPTINFEAPDEGNDLDYVPNQARQATVNVALSNGFGFGGHNATIALQKYNA